MVVAVVGGVIAIPNAAHAAVPTIVAGAGSNTRCRVVTVDMAFGRRGHVHVDILSRNLERRRRICCPV